jgi:hypothetical protein
MIPMREPSADTPTFYGNGAQMSAARDPTQIIVTIEHPFGTGKGTLAEWMATGPGPRPLLSPIAAYDRLAGKQLPLRVIPFRYRNNWLARLAISWRFIEDPWLRAD